jgi:hypothetical protein
LQQSHSSTLIFYGFVRPSASDRFPHPRRCDGLQLLDIEDALDESLGDAWNYAFDPIALDVSRRAVFFSWLCRLLFHGVNPIGVECCFFFAATALYIAAR